MRPFPVAPLSCRVRPVHQATQLTTLRLPQSVYIPMIAVGAGISNEIPDLNGLSALQYTWTGVPGREWGPIRVEPDVRVKYLTAPHVASSC